VDHLPGFRVEDQVGKTKGDARRITHDLEGMRAAHYGCNAAEGNDNRRYHYSKPVTQPATVTDKPTSQSIHRKTNACANTRWELGQVILGMGSYSKMTDDERQRLTVELTQKMNDEWRAA
jgi:hypothetical protein